MTRLRLTETGSRSSTASCPLSPACRQSGLSLLGVLIGIGMVALLTAAIAGLMHRNTGAAGVARERTVATFLAREAIELVRAIRDNNWLATPRCPEVGACQTFWRGTTSGPSALCNGTFRVDAATVDTVGLLPVTANAADTRLLLQGTTFSHGAGTTTPYRRWLELTSPEQGCGEASVFVQSAPSPSPGASPAPSPSSSPSPQVTPRQPQPLTVRAIVEWSAVAGVARRVELVEQLYPWMTVR